jgi:hypothetical protein
LEPLPSNVLVGGKLIKLKYTKKENMNRKNYNKIKKNIYKTNKINKTNKKIKRSYKKTK